MTSILSFSTQYSTDGGTVCMTTAPVCIHAGLKQAKWEQVGQQKRKEAICVYEEDCHLESTCVEKKLQTPEIFSSLKIH
jgi:hypothetical protein